MYTFSDLSKVKKLENDWNSNNRGAGLGFSGKIPPGMRLFLSRMMSISLELSLSYLVENDGKRFCFEFELKIEDTELQTVIVSNIFAEEDKNRNILKLFKQKLS